MSRRILPPLLLAAALAACAAPCLRAETTPQGPTQGAPAAISPKAQLVKQLAASPWHGDDGGQPSEPARPLSGVSGAGGVVPEGPQPVFDRATSGRQLAAWRAYYDYRISGLRHRAEVYAWQLTSSQITFVVVIFLVLVGIFFSWLQFRISLRPKPAPASAGAAPSAETAVAAAVTEISASLEGIKVSSPVLGVVILVISLLFFYLYLAYVYPISQNF